MRARRIIAVLAALTAALVATALPAHAAPARTITAQLTGYSYYDNTPPRSDRICCGVTHTRAGGTGTYRNPITAAAPGSSRTTMQYPPGTRFYLPTLRRYVIVEDSGATPNGNRPRLDIWVDGQGLPRSASDRCMHSITGTTAAVIHPSPSYRVTPGPLTIRTGCRI